MIVTLMIEARWADEQVHGIALYDGPDRPSMSVYYPRVAHHFAVVPEPYQAGDCQRIGFLPLGYDDAALFWRDYRHEIERFPW